MGAQAVRLSNFDIDNALKNKEFEVLFQPIFDLANGALARVETFIRWRHPSLGVLPPGAFISFFETQGRMSELTRYVLAEALREYQAWRGPYPPGFSINLALSDLTDEAFASHLTVVLRESGFPPECVTLECPMPPAPVDLAASSKQFQRLADTGARLAIEVRGRANDFLRSITPFPFAEIKTGGAAILRFARTVRGPGLSAISELLEMANAQNAAITAVGVEDQASLSALRGLGFAAAQGNHLGKVGALRDFTPSRVNEVRELLELEALSKEDLSALFRTGGPALSPAPERAAVSEEDLHAAANNTARHGKPDTDDLVERLAARIERADNEAVEPETPPAMEDQAAEVQSAQGRSTEDESAEDLDPENERALKAAAIARARAKLAHRAKKAAAARASRETEDGEALSPPRNMQNRLSEEFEAFADDERAAADLAAKADKQQAPADDQSDEAQSLHHDDNDDADDGADIDAAARVDDATETEEDAITAAPETEPAAQSEAALEAAPEHEISDDEFEIADEDEDQIAPEMKKAVGDAHVSIQGARARFVPGIRVMSAAPAFEDDEPQTFGKRPAAVGAPSPSSPSPAPAPDTEEPVAPLFDPAEGAVKTVAKAAAARPASNPDNNESDIGDLGAEAQETVWIEDSVAIDNAADAPRRRRKNFLKRKYKMPRYSGHFWPRPLRKWMKKRAAASAARSDDNAATE